jgi:hypothetical protein
LKSLTQRQTRSMGALMTVLTNTFAISVPVCSPLPVLADLAYAEWAMV